MIPRFRAQAQKLSHASNGGSRSPCGQGVRHASAGGTTRLMPSEHHAGELKRESAEVRAGRIIAQEMQRQGWTEAELAQRRKGDPVKFALAAGLRRQTTLTMG